MYSLFSSFDLLLIFLLKVQSHWIWIRFLVLMHQVIAVDDDNEPQQRETKQYDEDEFDSGKHQRFSSPLQSHFLPFCSYPQDQTFVVS